MSPHHKQEEEFSWIFASFEKHDRGLWWYVVAGVVVGLLLVWSYLTGNLLFGLLILIAIFVFLARHVIEPSAVDCAISESTIRVGTKEYSLDAIRYFWILEHDDNRAVLYIEEKGGLRSILPIPIHDHDPEELREFLRKFIEEHRERKHEPLLERMSRMLKIS